MKPYFSIRYKFLAVTTLLLAFCVGAYLLLATKEFKADKKTLVYDFNLSLVSNTSAQLETFFSGMADKLRIAAYLSRSKSADSKGQVAELFHGKQDLVFVAKSHRFQNLDEILFHDSEFEKIYGVNEEYFSGSLSAQRPIPYQEIQTRGEAIWNASLPNGPLLIGYGKSVVEEDQSGAAVAQFAMIGYLRADRIVAELKDGRPNEVFLISAEGEMLAHPLATKMAKGEKYQSQLTEIALHSQSKKSVAEFSEHGESFLGAYAGALKNRIYVFSQISERTAFQAVNRLVLRSLIFASMVVTLAFLAAIFFSRSLTRPIDYLVQAMRKVSNGDLSGHVTVQTRDEIAQLSGSFNTMISDLRTSRQELEDINRDLEDKVKERTHQLEVQNRAVKEAQEALLRTTRLAAAGEVAGQAAHEVLNPLTSIISRLNGVKNRISGQRDQEIQLLEALKASWQKDFDEGGFQKLKTVWETQSTVNANQTLWQEDLENLAQVSRHLKDEFKALSNDTEFLLSESERISRIVNSFRTLNSPQVNFRTLNISDLCLKCVNIMADLANGENIRLDKEFSAEALFVTLDEDEFIQVMTNLIRNSLHSVKSYQKNMSNAGFVKIKTFADEKTAFVSIIDNGSGIAKENLNRLFEKTFTTKSKSEGTGIGLSISRRLIRGSQGDLKLVRSEPGQGAEFQISLPRANKNSTRGAA